MENIKNTENTATDILNDEKRDFYDVKIVGKVDSYLKYDDGKFQLSFVEIKEDKLDDGTLNVDYIPRSVKLDKKTTEAEIKALVGQTLEFNEVKEWKKYKKIEDGKLDFSTPIEVNYTVYDFKKIEKVEDEFYFEVFRMFDIDKIINVNASTDYDRKTGKKTVKKGEATIQYFAQLETKRALKSILVRNLDYKTALKLVGKKVTVLDYNDNTKRPACTKLK